MPHRGIPKTQARVCKYCVKYIEAKISRRPTAAAPVVNHSITFAPMYSRRIEAAATDELLLQVRKQYADSFLPGNDLFVKSSSASANGSSSQSPARDGATVTLVSAPVEKTQLDITLPPAEFKEYVYPFPTAVAAAAGEHVVGLVLDAKPQQVSDAYIRLKGALTMAHKLAVETEPQAMPDIVRMPQYY